MAKLKVKIGQGWVACKGFLAKRWPWVVAVIVLLLVTFGLIYAGYKVWWWTGFGDYIGHVPARNRAKSLWDWLELLIVPLVLAAGAALFTWVTDRRAREIEEDRLKEQREIELDRSRDAALETYLRRVSSLLRSEWRESGEGFVEANIIRAQTLTTVRQLDGRRNDLIIRFLRESGLAVKKAVVTLSEADLRGADLRGVYLSEIDLHGANLHGVDLHGANLSRVDLSGANLSGANLRGGDISGVYLREADLRGADLRGANLHGANLGGTSLNGADLSGTNLDSANLRKVKLSRANLSKANLEGADLNEAILEGADLSGAILSGANLCDATVTDEQLFLASSLKGATMPDGTVHE
jgi:uncharacterized protein YjbI with pentapeptide repeats